MLSDPNLTYDEWWAIWGSSDVKVATKVWRRMRHNMSSDARAWWGPRIEATFSEGFATSGSTGLCAKIIIPLLMRVCGFDIKEWAETGFSHEYISSNSHVLEKSANWLRRLFPSVLAPFAGVPPNQIGPEFYTRGSFVRSFSTPNSAARNYFYRFYYEQEYKDQTCCPRTLQPMCFEALRTNAGCFEWHCAVQETTERVKPRSFTKLVLLDHMDWMPNSLVHDEWIALQRASIPGAKVLWRSAFTNMNAKPFFINLDIEDLSPRWYSKDRVKMMYPGTFLSYTQRSSSVCRRRAVSVPTGSVRS